jgi:hypothetical protein
MHPQGLPHGVAVKPVDAGPQAQLGAGHHLSVQATEVPGDDRQVSRCGAVDQPMPRHPPGKRLFPRDGGAHGGTPYPVNRLPILAVPGVPGPDGTGNRDGGDGSDRRARPGTATAPNDVWVVGTVAEPNSTAHWNGTSWSVLPAPCL